jgi:hypothetical protein
MRNPFKSHISTRAGGLLLASSLLVVALPSQAVLLLDQSCTGPNTQTILINDAFSSVGQTFTAGLSGTLGGVNLDILSIYPQSTIPLHVAVHSVTGGLPGSSILGETTVATNTITMDRLVTFPQTISITAGVQYAITVDYVGAPALGNAQGWWLGGSSSGGYVGGDAAGFNGSTWASLPGIDGHFQTYVVPIPEPRALHLLAVGLLAFLSQPRRFTKRE